VCEAAKTSIFQHATFSTMAKEKSEKRDKKEKKEKRSEADGVKKSKKDKKSKLNGDNVAAAFEEATKEVKPEVETKEVLLKEEGGELVLKPMGALVPFANPLADEKVAKKVLKSVKKGAICCYVLAILPISYA
jgi:H/ACA ribonucleoprotein complex subunit 2